MPSSSTHAMDAPCSRASAPMPNTLCILLNHRCWVVVMASLGQFAGSGAEARGHTCFSVQIHVPGSLSKQATARQYTILGPIRILILIHTLYAERGGMPDVGHNPDVFSKVGYKVAEPQLLMTTPSAPCDLSEGTQKCCVPGQLWMVGTLRTAQSARVSSR
jgi:hypothetical protein